MPWSDWQDPLEYDLSATITEIAQPQWDVFHQVRIGNPDNRFATGETTMPVLTDWTTEGPTQLTDLRDATVYDSDNGNTYYTETTHSGLVLYFTPGANPNAGIELAGNWFRVPGGTGYYEDQKSQSVASHPFGIQITDDAADFRDPFPQPLDDLIYGVDFTEIPDTGDYVEYEATDSIRLGWNDVTGWQFTMTGQSTRVIAPGDPDTSSLIEPLDLRWNLYLMPEDVPVPGDWPDGGENIYYGEAGTLLAELHRDISAYGFIDVPIPASTETVDVDLSTNVDVDRDGFWLAVLSPWVTGDEAYPFDANTPSIDPDNITAEQYDTVAGCTPILPDITIRYELPRWRYWIPEPEPLRTIGDHFRTVGGADIKSLIPGVGWVKVRPGV